MSTDVTLDSNPINTTLDSDPSNITLDSDPRDFMFSLIEKEYNKELDRVKNLDIRTNIFITLGGVLLVYLPGNLRGFINMNTSIDNLSTLSYELFKLIILSGIFLFLILAFMFFSLVLGLKSYNRVDISIFSEENFTYPKSFWTKQMIILYRKNIEQNSAVNNKKAKFYNYGFYCIILTLLLTILSYIIVIFS